MEMKLSRKSFFVLGFGDLKTLKAKGSVCWFKELHRKGSNLVEVETQPFFLSNFGSSGLVGMEARRRETNHQPNTKSRDKTAACTFFVET